MKLPRKIEIGPFTYTVNQNWDPPSFETKWGFVDFRNLTIEIYHDLPDVKKRSILFHEILHVLWNYGSMEGLDEEKSVEILEIQLMTLFKRNPKLKEVLFGD